MAYYNYEKGKKGYAFGSGKFTISPRQESKMKAEQVISGSKSNETPLEEEGLVKKVNPREVAEAKAKEVKNEKKMSLVDEDKEEEPFLKKEEEVVEEQPTSNESIFDTTLVDLGIPINNYTGTDNKDKIYHIDGKPVEYSSSEVSSGGKIDPNLTNVAKEVFPGLKGVPGMKVTGGNDAYHLSDEYYTKKWKKKQGIEGDLSKDQLSSARAYYKKNPSKHTNGRSMDFVVNNNPKTLKSTRDHFLSLGLKYDKETGTYSNDKYKILDEYSHPSSGTTNPHFHVEVFKDGKWQTTDGHKD